MNAYLDISMKDLSRVQLCEPVDYLCVNLADEIYLDEYGSDFGLLKVFALLLVFDNLLKQVTLAGELHYYAMELSLKHLPKRVLFIKKSLFIADDIGVANGGEKAHFIQRICSIFCRESVKHNFFKSVNFIVGNPFHFVNAAETALP